MPAAARFVAVLKSCLFSLVLAFAVLAPSGASADDRSHHDRLIDRIVVFGDSLSDSGNAFALLGGDFVAPPDYGMAGTDPVTGIPDVIALIPAFPYKTEHFSNGRRTWIEVLADAAGLGSSAKPAVLGVLLGQDDGKASNYAVGGARAAPVGSLHLGEQVGLFLLDAGGRGPSSALYVIEIGGNDIRDALVAADPFAVIGQAVNAIEQSIVALHGAGARKFLVWNVPDLGRSPALQRLNEVAVPGIAGFATFLSGVYNATLGARLQVLAGLEDIDIVPFDVFENLHAIQENPRRFGLDDATTACIEPDVPTFGFPSSPPFRCAPQDRHFFWDGIHPTRAGHRIIAELVAKELGAELVLDD